MFRTSHILKENTLVCVVETFYDGRTWRMLREDLIDLQLFLKLLSLELPRLRDFDHNARMDFIDERDGSFPDPVYIGKLALIAHEKYLLKSVRKEVSRGDVAADGLHCDWFLLA